MKISALPYRPCVGIALFNRDGLVFAAERIDTPGAWQMPQGGIDKGEEPRQAAMRELEEEIGTNAAEIIAEAPDWLTYDLPAELLGRAWKGKYRGQKQRWFALRFTGSDADIDIVTKHPEFRVWRWLPLAELPSLIVPFKRHVYDAVAREFAGIPAVVRG